jgi:hypothetical protein
MPFQLLNYHLDKFKNIRRLLITLKNLRMLTITKKTCKPSIRVHRAILINQTQTPNHTRLSHLDSRNNIFSSSKRSIMHEPNLTTDSHLKNSSKLFEKGMNKLMTLMRGKCKR